MPPKGLATLLAPLLGQAGTKTVGKEFGNLRFVLPASNRTFTTGAARSAVLLDRSALRGVWMRQRELMGTRRSFSDLRSTNLLSTLRTRPFNSPSSSPVAQVHSRIRLLSTASITPGSTSSHSTTSSSSSSSTNSDLPRLTTPLVSKYLFVVAGMVFLIVIVGGMTRLTESGLSITEWNVISGMRLPLTGEEWEKEFEKYRQTPEWKINNQHITLSDFKRIYMWEWSHRMLGRLIGLTFLLPLPYFLYRRQLSRTALLPLLGIGSLIGGQGALGWYMVKSGLDAESVEDLGGVPRVSQYRLAAHLGMAFCVFALCLRMGLGVKRDWQVARLGQGVSKMNGVGESLRVLEGTTAGRLRVAVTALSGLVFLTAFSGAFVAGLDAGLIYNEWPTMGDGFSPGMGELYKDFYARKEDKSDKWWRNMFENPTTAQFDHRMLAYTTFLSIVTLFGVTRRPSIRNQLPPLTNRLIKASLHMSLLQVALGISTLLYLVPTHLAATHQAGSLVLLTLVLGVGASLRRPGKVAREVLRIKAIKEKAAKL
ncbi:Cox15p [Sporobolomyces salmoneus]|uniref:Cox15p n=1 Tax=Sporobolomyces salmoneus TaxID=183962 RepID=UPI00318279EE